jgi:hypothetical protein
MPHRSGYGTATRTPAKATPKKKKIGATLVRPQALPAKSPSKKSTFAKGKPGEAPASGRKQTLELRRDKPKAIGPPLRKALPFKKRPTPKPGPDTGRIGRGVPESGLGGRKAKPRTKPGIGAPLRRAQPAPGPGSRRKPGPDSKMQIGKGVPETLGGDRALGGPSRRKRIAARKAAPPRAKPTFDPRTTGTKAARPSASSKRAKQTERTKPVATAKQTAKAGRDRAQAAQGDARRAAEKLRGIKKAAPAARKATATARAKQEMATAQAQARVTKARKAAPAKAKARATKPAAKKAAPKITAQQRAIKTGQAARTARARRKSRL